MKIKNLLMAVLIAAASTAGFAGVLTFADGEAKIDVQVASPTFHDVYNLKGLGAGTYDFSGTLSGSYVSFTSVTLNGQAWTVTPNGGFSFASIEYSGSGPFQLIVDGVKLTAPKKFTSGYTGTIFAVSAVPEPETYAMLLAGLGVMGAIARRRKQAA